MKNSAFFQKMFFLLMYDHVFAGKPLVEFYPKLKESDLVTDEFLGKVKEIMDGIIIKRKNSLKKKIPAVLNLDVKSLHKGYWNGKKNTAIN